MDLEATPTNRQKWIDTGYKLFGEIGTQSLNVKKLSSLVGLNRSSFYHYFKDLERFEEALFDRHLERFELLGEIIKDFEDFEQLFNDEVFEHKDALAFQRQLLINQSSARYKDCSERVRQFTEAKTFELWTAVNKSEKTDKEQWDVFRAIRDFYYIHHGQSNGPGNPKELMVLLNKYLNREV